MKTLIELFDTCQIENVIAGMRFLPEKIVFVGFKEMMTRKRIEDLERFFALRGLGIKAEYEIVPRYDFDAIVKTLNSILDRHADCYFDLTGGKELVLVAMGVISAVRNVPMLQFDVRTGRLLRIRNCDDIAETEKSTMQIGESVVLNGGAVIRNAEDDFCWTLTTDFKKDIRTIWKICRRNCGLWNRQSRVFENFEKFCRLGEDLSVCVNLQQMKDGKQDTLLDNWIINDLIRNGLLLDYAVADDILTFRYKNRQVHQCISKAGNILELYTYMTAREIAGDDPGYYDDIDIGVFVDWDGVLHEADAETKDTKNEIDIMLMRDVIPIFISCKNGEVHKEALYELDTVAQRFGGEYAKKILLTTYISTDAKARQYLLQRARDMKIDVIENVDKMTDEEFKRVLRQRAK